MSVNGISDAHLPQPDKPTTQASTREHNRPPKTGATLLASPHAQANGAEATQVVAVAKNHAGKEPGSRQQQEQETKGTRSTPTRERVPRHPLRTVIAQHPR